MEGFTPWSALTGGVLIGIAVTILLLGAGRIAGISGILANALLSPDQRLSRWLFLLGLVGGAAVHQAVAGPAFAVREDMPVGLLIAAGLAVGFGTRLGSGCTSGHGVCGIARLSRRSLLATALFMLSAALTVFVVRHVAGIPT